MEKFAWGLARIAPFLSLIFIFHVLFGDGSAIQEASGAAVAVALTVVPYCWARAITLSKRLYEE